MRRSVLGYTMFYHRSVAMGILQKVCATILLVAIILSLSTEHTIATCSISTGTLNYALDFNPQAERYFFNSADQVIGLRGIFAEGGEPVAAFLNGVPISYAIAGGFSLSFLPLWNSWNRSVKLLPHSDTPRSAGSKRGLHMNTTWRDYKRPRVSVTVGDETGDAMILDFLDEATPVGNRGSLLGVEAGAGGGSLQKRWAVGVQYRWNDWLAYRRHGIRVSVAPVEAGRENVGTEEKAALLGVYEWSAETWRTRVEAVAQTFPALWITDAGTRRTTKWSGNSAIGTVRTSKRFQSFSWLDRLSFAASSQLLHAENVHHDSEADVRYADHTSTVHLSVDGIVRRGRQTTFLLMGIRGSSQNIRVDPTGSEPSHGLRGPSSLLTGGGFLEISHFPTPARCLWFEGTADKREGSSTVTLLEVGGFTYWSRTWRSELRVHRSARDADVFRTYGWSRVTHDALGGEEALFEGGRLDSEKLHVIDMELAAMSGSWPTFSVNLFRERVEDCIVTVAERWNALQDDRERIRSGYWTNGGSVTSTGLEITAGAGGQWGTIRGFLFLRDVDWEADSPDVSHPPLGGKLGGGIQSTIHLPKRTQFTTRLRAVEAPRFSPYGSWTENTSTDRVRCDVELKTCFSDGWEAVITALDLQHQGRIEIPGGNAVGFRVVGQLRYNWQKRAKSGKPGERKPIIVSDGGSGDTKLISRHGGMKADGECDELLEEGSLRELFWR